MSTAPTPVAHAVVLSPLADGSRRLAKLLAILADAGVQTSVVNTPKDAAAAILLAEHGEPQCLIIDASDAAGGEPQAIADVSAVVENACGIMPHVPPIVVAPDPHVRLVIRCVRAGAADFIDLASDTVGDVKRALGRVAASYTSKTEHKRHLDELRGVIEEFLRDLVKTERRSIDLEHRLRQRERGPYEEPIGELDEDRAPCVFIVEDDKDVADMLADELERYDLITFAFVTGEDAVLYAERMANRGEAIDLALVDGRLPGIHGLETIRRLREHKPGLAAILMTGFSDNETAANAADLGVVGYVLKPFDNVAALVMRIKETAERAMANSREQHYLQRIKQRHEKVLMRYRKLAAELEELG